MKNLSILMIAGLAALLTTACAPVVYESPQAGYPVIIQDHAPVVVTHHPGYRNGKAHRQQHAHIERELARRHQHVTHIYNGYGQPGELVEINLQGGYLWHQGRRVHYSPINFMIAVGDIIRLPSGYLDVDLFVRYENGRIALDTDIFGRFSHTVAHLSFGNDWQRERHYKVDNRHMKGAKIIVKAVPPKHKHKHWKGDDSPKHQPDRDRHAAIDKRHNSRSDQKSSKVVAYKKEQKYQNKDKSVTTTRTVKRKVVTRLDDDTRDQRRGKVKTHKDEKSYEKTRESRHEKGLDRYEQPEKVKVVFRGGTIERNGRQDKLKKTSVTIKKGETKQVRLHARDGKDVKVPVSYKNGRVIVDHGEKDRPREFRVSDREHGTQKYELSTRGRNRLDNINLEVSSL